MGISTKSTYGLRAMYELALNYGNGTVSISEISEREAISVPYLEQLLNRLRKAGLVTSIRGSHGGYTLSRKPVDITVGDIVRTLDGAIMPDHCLSSDKKGLDQAAPGECVTNDLWARLKFAVEKMLNEITLEDMCKKGRLARILEEVEPSGELMAQEV